MRNSSRDWLKHQGIDASLSLLKEILNVPWKLNIVIIDAIYEKATVKENF